MKVIVVGAGTVGRSIASFLAREDYEIIVVDLESERLQWLEEYLDVQTFVGNACDPGVLSLIGVEKVEVFLAVTDRDEVNLVAAFAAKALGARKVVARVRSRHYYEAEGMSFREPLGIDLFISPEIMSAWELANSVGTPSALAMATLAKGEIHLRTVRLAEGSDYAGKKLMDISLPKGALVVGIRRENEILIPRGNTVLHEEDRVTLIGLAEKIESVSESFTLQPQHHTLASVAIAGAGDTGLFLANILERRGHRVTVIERDRSRAEFIGEKLRSSLILNGDATDVNVLREERIDQVDYFISVMGDDEENIMASLLAKELGVPKAACLIDRPDYARIMEKIGIDVALSPRFLAANRVMALLKRGKIRGVTLLEEGEIEVLEYQALAKSPIVGQPLKDIKTPKDVLIGAVLQGGNVIIPRGDDVIRPGAIVVAVAKPDTSEDVEALFAPESEES